MKEEKLQEQIHKWRMEEIEARKQAELSVERLKHDNQMEMQRIRNADIARNKLRGHY